ncbi:MAG: alpha-1,2-fucosyltransferase [Parvibaculum sp.]
MKRKVLVTCDGRLGNQLFIAAFIDQNFPADTEVISTGFQEMQKGFDWDRSTKTLDSQKWKTRFLFRAARRLAKLHLIDHIFQTKFEVNLPHGRYRLLDEKIRKTSGLLPLTLIDRSHLQHHSHVEKVHFHLKDEHKVAAREFLAQLPEGPRAFVHVRQGDYKEWTIIGKSPLLPISYFKEGIERIRTANPDTIFICVSDNIEDAKTALGSDGLYFFAGKNVYEDFAMMTLCDGGVVSNSTLSWWGGYLSSRKLPVIAPENWVGFPVGFEYPVGIVGRWMQTITVKPAC